MRHCANVTCVLSKVDAYVDWRLIRDVDTGHLKRAGLDVPIVPVSALLHLTARRRARAELDVESGIEELVRLLSQRIVADVEASQLLETVADVESSLTQLRGVLLAEIAALDPARHAAIVDDLRATLANVGELRLDNAAWHRFLRDSTDDLRVASLDDFEERARQLISEAESVIAANDPTVIWDEFQVWLRQRATRLVGDLYGEIADQVDVIEQRLLAQLATAEGEALTFGSGLSSPFVGALSLDVMENRPVEERATDVAIESSWSAAEPLLGIGGFIPGLGPVSLVVAAVAGLVFGRRALKQRKARALDARREERAVTCATTPTRWTGSCGAASSATRTSSTVACATTCSGARTSSSGRSTTRCARRPAPAARPPRSASPGWPRCASSSPTRTASRPS